MSGEGPISNGTCINLNVFLYFQSSVNRPAREGIAPSCGLANLDIAIISSIGAWIQRRIRAAIQLIFNLVINRVPTCGQKHVAVSRIDSRIRKLHALGGIPPLERMPPVGWGRNGILLIENNVDFFGRNSSTGGI